MRTTFVVDTSVLVSDFNVLFAYPNTNMVLSSIVIDELDNLKKRSDDVGRNAREVIRILDRLTKDENINLHEGLDIDNDIKIRIIIAVRTKMFKLRAVIHCPGFLHGTSCTCLAAVSLAIYQCDGAKPRQCGIRHWLNCFYQSAPYRNGGYQSAGIAGVSGIIAAVDGSHSRIATGAHHFGASLRLPTA